MRQEGGVGATHQLSIHVALQLCVGPGVLLSTSMQAFKALTQLLKGLVESLATVAPTRPSLSNSLPRFRNPGTEGSSR
jgi:hypothetical protein